MFKQSEHTEATNQRTRPPSRPILVAPPNDHRAGAERGLKSHAGTSGVDTLLPPPQRLPRALTAGAVFEPSFLNRLTVEPRIVSHPLDRDVNGSPRLLDERAAAKFLGVSPRTLWRLADAGEIPFIRVGPRLKRYDPRDLQAFIDRNRRTNDTACDNTPAA